MPLDTTQDTEPDAPAAPRDGGFADDVKDGLTRSPKHIPAKYLYDEAGSRLFEAICVLPEYYLTRAEHEILTTHARDIVAGMPDGVKIVEFGAGSAVKTRILIEGYLADHEALSYCPIDISYEAMRTAQANIRAEFPSVHFDGIHAEYEVAAAQLRGDVDHAKLVLFLGSSIGNFTPDGAERFLALLRTALSDPDRDRLLIGMDAAKDPSVLCAAYDDGAGVTAAFNKNLLNRINRELGGRFDLRKFRHEAQWNADESRVEMHLVSEVAQTVRIEDLGLDVSFAASESIHTENSYKFTGDMRERIFARAGLQVERSWSDRQDRYDLHLVRPKV